MEAWKSDRVGSAEAGRNPMVIAKMPSGYAVMGDTQFLPGYCVLLASPRVDHLSALALDERTTFLRDMSVLGEAVERACASNGLRRINYDILGNTDTFLHAHVFPRYSWEPADRVTMPVFLYPGDRWSDPHYHYTDQQHGALRVSIKDELVRITRDIVSGADKGS